MYLILAGLMLIRLKGNKDSVVACRDWLGYMIGQMLSADKCKTCAAVTVVNSLIQAGVEEAFLHLLMVEINLRVKGTYANNSNIL